MRVSVVITYFNKGELVIRAVSSLENQVAPEDEVLIVDDASQDSFAADALNVLKKAGIRSSLTSLPLSLGPGNAKNVGIDMAQGDIMILLDADDELPPGSIDVIRQTFLDHPQADFIFGDYMVRDELGDDGERVNCSQLTGTEGWLDMEKLANSWVLLGSSPFRKSRLWPRTMYPTKFANTDDLDFWRSAILAGARGMYISEQIYIWNRQPVSNNSTQDSSTLAKSWLRNKAFYRRALPTRKYWRHLGKNFLMASFPGRFSRSIVTFFGR